MCFDLCADFPDSDEEDSDSSTNSENESNGGGKINKLKGGGTTNSEYVKKLAFDFNQAFKDFKIYYPHPINDMYIYIKRKIEFLITNIGVIINSSASNKKNLLKILF